ncbi:MAG: hypothetical protein Q9216_005822 [Gyalolechia sp. 2 TL-2023]
MSALTRNPHFHKAALGVGAFGTMAVKAALMDDFGSAECGAGESSSSAAGAGADVENTGIGSEPAGCEQYGGGGYGSYGEGAGQGSEADPAAVQARLLVQGEGQQNAMGLI